MKMSQHFNEVLTRAGAILATPDRWTQGACARDKNRSPVVSTHPEAVCWCSVGAMEKAIDDYKKETGIQVNIQELGWHLYHKAIKPNYFFSCVTSWNDNVERKHSEIVAAFEQGARIGK